MGQGGHQEMETLMSMKSQITQIHRITLTFRILVPLLPLFYDPEYRLINLSFEEGQNAHAPFEKTTF